MLVYVEVPNLSTTICFFRSFRRSSSVLSIHRQPLNCWGTKPSETTMAGHYCSRRRRVDKGIDTRIDRWEFSWQFSWSGRVARMCQTFFYVRIHWNAKIYHGNNTIVKYTMVIFKKNNLHFWWEPFRNTKRHISYTKSKVMSSTYLTLLL